MLILFHKNNKVVEVVDQKYNTVITCLDDTPLKVMFSLASSHGNRIIAWCHLSSRNNINVEAIKSCFTTTNVMISSSFSSYFGGAIGYVEDSPFININKKVKGEQLSQSLRNKNISRVDPELNALEKKIINNGVQKEMDKKEKSKITSLLK